jgi:hypothetical protein
MATYRIANVAAGTYAVVATRIGYQFQFAPKG